MRASPAAVGEHALVLEEQRAPCATSTEQQRHERPGVDRSAVQPREVVVGEQADSATSAAPTGTIDHPQAAGSSRAAGADGCQAATAHEQRRCRPERVEQPAVLARCRRSRSGPGRGRPPTALRASPTPSTSQTRARAASREAEDRGDHERPAAAGRRPGRRGGQRSAAARCRRRRVVDDRPEGERRRAAPPTRDGADRGRRATGSRGTSRMRERRQQQERDVAGGIEGEPERVGDARVRRVRVVRVRPRSRRCPPPSSVRIAQPMTSQASRSSRTASRAPRQNPARGEHQAVVEVVLEEGLESRCEADAAFAAHAASAAPVSAAGRRTSQPRSAIALLCEPYHASRSASRGGD